LGCVPTAITRGETLLAITIHCENPSCKREFRVKDELAGKRVKCPKCGEAILVSAAVAASLPEDLAPKPSVTVSDEMVKNAKPTMSVGVPQLGAANSPPPVDTPLDEPTRISPWLFHARSHYFRVLGPMLGFAFVAFLINLAEAPVVVLLPFALPQLLAAGVDALLGAGITAVCLAQLKEEHWTFGTFFSGFSRRRIGAIFGFFVATTVIGFAILLILLLPIGLVFLVVNTALGLFGKDIHSDHIISFGSLIAIFCSLVAAAFVWLRLRFFGLPLILDQGLPVGEALKTSWRLSRGKSWTLLKVMAILAGLHLVVFLPALAVGISSQFVMAAVMESQGQHDYQIVDRLQGIALFLTLCGLLVQPFIIPFSSLTVTAGYLLMTGTKLPSRSG
jgi:membrane-anchored glycerophosphoryl diester phosphodiesterase (GDPDase)